MVLIPKGVGGVQRDSVSGSHMESLYIHPKQQYMFLHHPVRRTELFHTEEGVRDSNLGGKDGSEASGYVP